MIVSELRTKLVMARVELGLNQKEAAQKVNMPLRTLQNWETGVRTPADYIVDWYLSMLKGDLK